jgi:hypothetical protein
MSVGIHCGVQTLGWKLNGQVWTTSEGGGTSDWVPTEWIVDPTMPDGPLVVDAELSADGETLTLAQSGRAVVYNSSGTEFMEDQLCA